MNLQQLRAICVIVECAYNVSDAARRLHLSQSALSKQLRLFESEMRTEVFHRSRGRLVSLTPVGKRILLAAQGALGSVDEIRSLCGTEDEPKPDRFVVGASRSLARDFLPDVIARFLEKYGGVEVSIVHHSLAGLTRMLLQGELSLVLTIENAIENSHVVNLPIHAVPRVVAVPRGHPLTRLSALTLEAMAAHPLVLYDDSFSVRHEVLKAFRDHRLMPRIALNAPSAEVIKAHVSKGIGIAVLARWACDPQGDRDIVALEASHLFPDATARILFNRHHYLRNFELDFMSMCAPSWSKRRILRLQEQDAR